MTSRKDETIASMDSTIKYQVEIINKQEKTIEEQENTINEQRMVGWMMMTTIKEQQKTIEELKAKLEEQETVPPLPKEEKVSSKPIDLLLDPENKSQMDMMDDTKTRNVIQSEAGEEIELDDELLEYLLKCGIIQKSGTPESTERKVESYVDVLNEMKAYLKEERANRNKPNEQPKTNMARMVDLLRRL